MIMKLLILFTFLIKSSIPWTTTLNPQIARLVALNPAMKPISKNTTSPIFITSKYPKNITTMTPTVKFTPPFMADPPIDHELKHLLMVKKVRAKSHGTPDLDTGLRIKNWNNDPNRKGNPEELSRFYFEGDILDTNLIAARSGLIDEAYRWPKGFIPYKITGTFSLTELKMILSAMDEFHRNTCIRFVPYLGFEADYINIESAETGCWSALGRVGGPQSVNLQSPGCLRYVGTIIHELMHVVGFFHEQSRTDRDGFVSIDWLNIIAGQEGNFGIYDSTAFGVPYDYGSLMHYSAFVFSKNTLPTIITKTVGALIGQRKAFSASDIEKVKLMYKCFGPISLLPL